MFFQFSPPVRQEKKLTKKVPQITEIATLTLAPFTPLPKILFDNVKVGDVAIERLCIKNPNPTLEVTASITLSEDIDLQLNWSQKSIEHNETENLQIIWKVTSVGSWRIILKIITGRQVRDIPIVLRSVPSSNTAVKRSKTKTLPRCSIKQLPAKWKSPNKKTAFANASINVPDIAIFSPEVINKITGKENEFLPEMASTFILPNRRETYIVKKENNFDDSLEINRTPSPNTSFLKKLQSDSFDLSLTPNLGAFKQANCSTEEKPRGLSAIREDSENVNLQNLSNETYIRGNLSTETYIKNNLSSDTYTKDLSDKELNEFLTPPLSLSRQSRVDSLSSVGLKSIIEADLWSNTKPSRLLSIKEENLTPISLKRKLEILSFIPAKRLYLDVSSKEQRVITNEWSSLKIASLIDPAMVVFLENQEENFQKWLNTILAPSDLQTHEKPKLDVEQLWRDIQKKKIIYEENILVNDDCTKLNAIRKSARLIYKSNDMQLVLQKVYSQIDSKRLSVRNDRNVHLDLGLQSDIMSIVLSYNPIWLRIGLETIYNRIIPLRDNSDIIGLTTFLSQFFIRNQFYLKKFKSIHTPNYTTEIKKYILKKFLTLVYVLDVFKTRKIIPHDPCLFRKQALVKESRAALLGFSRDILSSMGDITKYLRHYGYTVTYKQSYLDEFDYTVNSLGCDLRDGVRLIKVLEIILLQSNLLNSLRVPAISRLQKIHNMKLVFETLGHNKFEVLYEISPEDIVNGHKEKTLCFLWQIIYKFHTPLMAKNVTIITKWWRSDKIVEKRAKLREIRAEKQRLLENAVVKIQRFWRAIWLKKVARKRFELFKNAVIVIQRKFRATVLARREREKFLSLKYATILIQKRWRQKNQKNVEKAVIKIQSFFRMIQQKRRYFKLQKAVLLIQRQYRAQLKMRQEMQSYQTMKATTLMVQRRFRANCLMKIERNRFEVLKSAAIIIQQKFRATLLARTERQKFVYLKALTISMQQHWRARKQAQLAVIKIQSFVRMYQQRRRYVILRKTVLWTQRQLRAQLEMRKQLQSYQTLKASTIMIQQRFRANCLMKIERNRFEVLKSAAILIQHKFRATLLARSDRQKFILLRALTISMQKRWRDKKQKQIEEAAIRIQSFVRMFQEKSRYLLLQKSVVFIQRRFRAQLEMRKHLQSYQNLRATTIMVQQRFRANLIMKTQSYHFKEFRRHLVFIQRLWRANCLMKIERTRFNLQKTAAILIQDRFRATLLAKAERDKFIRLKALTILMQKRWRDKKQKRIERAVIRIQRFVRMNQQKNRYLLLRKSVLVIQRRFRAQLEMRKQLRSYQSLKATTIVIQQRFRANLIMKTQSYHFKEFRRHVIFIQRLWRANCLMKVQRTRFNLLKTAVILIQHRFRATVLARTERDNFIRLKTLTILMQKRWRYKKQKSMEKAVIKLQSVVRMYQHKTRYLFLRRTVLSVQRRFRAQLEMRKQLRYFQTLKASTVMIQQRFRANCLMKIERKRFELGKSAALVIQHKFRATLLARTERQNFIRLKTLTVLMQKRWRDKKQKLLENAVIRIQSFVRMYQQNRRYLLLRKSVLLIQRKFRAHVEMRKHFEFYQNLKATTIRIQRRFRMNLILKNQLLSTEVVSKLMPYIKGFLLRRNIASLLSSTLIEERRQLRLQHRAAVRIQALWKGYKIRKNLKPNLQKVYINLKKANDMARPETTLAARCQSACLALKQNPSVEDFVKLFTDFEYITRRCAVSLTYLSHRLPRILYKAISSTNRSPHEIEICTLAAAILLNMHRYDQTKSLTWMPEHMESFTTVMLHFCDNDCPLFPTLATLFWLFLQNDAYKNVIVNTFKFNEKMLQIKNKCERKAKMIGKVKIRYNSYFKCYKNLPLPCINPDWGLDYPKNPRIFLNSCQAVICILNILNM